MPTPNTGIPYVPENTLNPAAGLNLALNVIDALLQTRVISMSLTAPPGSPNDGDRYVPAATASGEWAGKENYVARYVEEGNFWQFYEPGEQVSIIVNDADGVLYVYDPISPSSGWSQVQGGGSGGDTYYTKAWTPAAIGGAAHTQYPAGSYTTPSKGTGDYGQYLDRRLATAGDSSANTRAGYRSSAVADEVYANATRSRAAGFEFVMRAAIRSFRSDMRCFFGLAPNAALGVSADPSGNVNVIGIGKDAADSTFQIITNDASGTASKTDTGITCAAGVTLTLKLSVPVGGGNCDWTVTNEDTGTSASGSISSDLPATDAALYWNLYVQNGPTGGTACAAEYSLVGIRYPATPI